MLAHYPPSRPPRWRNGSTFGLLSSSVYACSLLGSLFWLQGRNSMSCAHQRAASYPARSKPYGLVSWTEAIWVRQKLLQVCECCWRFVQTLPNPRTRKSMAGNTRRLGMICSSMNSSVGLLLAEYLYSTLSTGSSIRRCWTILSRKVCTIISRLLLAVIDIKAPKLLRWNFMGFQTTSCR